MTGGQRLIGIVLFPKRTFDDINQKPTWLLPFALLLLFNVAVNFVVYRVLITDANFDQIARTKVEWDARAARLQALRPLRLLPLREMPGLQGAAWPCSDNTKRKPQPPWTARASTPRK
jgi:hypothetical protein